MTARNWKKRAAARRMWLQKLAHDLKGYLLGNEDFGFVEASLTSWAYPLDLDFTLRQERLHYEPKDAQGIPLRVYLSVGPQYNPTRIAAYALAHYNRYLRTGQEVHRRTFFRMADWFLQAPEGRWVYTYPWGDLTPPWISAMAQGEGISVLVRAWVLSGDERYLAKARQALQPLLLPLEQGGVRSALEDGSPFLEEYPTRPPDHVLNGFLYALIGLVDLQQVRADWVAPVDLEALLDTLERHLDWWDTGFWSVYDLGYRRTGVPNLVTVSYHNLHITQLTFLGLRTNRPQLVAVAKRWATYARRPLYRWRAFLGKVRYRLLYPGAS